MLPGDRLVCAFVEPQAVGTQFSAWMLHVTIVPWFRLDEPTDVISHDLWQVLKHATPFLAIAGGQALFGVRKTKPVRLLQPVLPFKTLEQKTRAYLRKKHAWLVDETTRSHREFVPHATDQADARLQEGDAFWCAQLYIVEQKGKAKEIVGEIQFGETTA